jgi:hypothetical protein
VDCKLSLISALEGVGIVFPRDKAAIFLVGLTCSFSAPSAFVSHAVDCSAFHVAS